MAKTLSKRYSGVLAHPTSFPSPYGIGDFGKGAYDFINFLTGAGQSLWQILPLGHTGYGDSPYQAFSAFAGQPLLISPDELVKDGLLYGDDLRNYPHFNPDHIYYGDVIPAKLRILHRSYEIFKESADLCMLKEFDVFCEHEKDWLDDYALFMAGKTHTAVHAGWSGKMICVTLMRRLKLHGVSVWLIPSNTTSTFSSSSSVSGTQFAIMHM